MNFKQYQSACVLLDQKATEFKMELDTDGTVLPYDMCSKGPMEQNTMKHFFFFLVLRRFS